MADEGDESRMGSRMDLNLYLGLPRSPRRRVLDLGSDLSLSSIPPSSSSSSTTETSRAPMEIGASSAAVEITEVDAPYSPSNALYSVADLVPIDPLPGPVLPQFVPSHDPAGPSFIPIPSTEHEPEELQPLQTLQTLQELEERMVVEVDESLPYYPVSPPQEPPAEDPPYSPLMVPYSPTFPSYRPEPVSLGGGADGSSSRQELLQYPELRFRRLIESHNRWPLRRFRSSLSYNGGRSDLGPSLPPVPESLLQETVGKNKVDAEGATSEASEEEQDDKSKGAVNFECNICLDMAKEPVVTSCGHLFCWPCLYQWLHLHSEHKECPVCKGEVTESKITPIYGRGSSKASEGSKCGEDAQLGLKIPPRPRGNRVESFRQQLRPISRRLREGIASSWRRLLDERHGDPSMHEMFDVGHRRHLTRLRATRMREGANIERALNVGETLPVRNSTADPQNSSRNSPFRDGMDLWQQLSVYDFASSDRLATLTTNLGRVFERLATTAGRYGASASSANPPNPEPPVSNAPVAAALAADQVSASSTMAVIHGDVAVPDSAAEPNSAGSSRSFRRRGRSSASSSLDVDGGALHVRKRRRLN